MNDVTLYEKELLDVLTCGEFTTGELWRLTWVPFTPESEGRWRVLLLLSGLQRRGLVKLTRMSPTLLVWGLR